MGTHTVGYGRAHDISQSGRRKAAPGFRRKNRRDIGKWSRLAWARGINPLGIARRKRTNVTVERKRLRYATEQKEADMPRRLSIARDPAAGKQGLDLRGKAECPTIVGGVQRLY